MTSHTPGPWGYDTLHDHLLVMARYKPLPEFCVADLGPGQAYPSAKEQVANARLIAAAPDLLAALDFLLLQVDTVDRTSVVRESAIYREARAAIAKAKGSAS